MLAEVKLIIIKNTAAQQVGLNSRRTKRGEIEIWGSLRKSYKWWYRKIPVLLWRPPGSFLQEKPAKKSPLSLIFFFFSRSSPAGSYLFGQAITCFPVHPSAGMGSSIHFIAAARLMQTAELGSPTLSKNVIQSQEKSARPGSSPPKGVYNHVFVFFKKNNIF